MSEERVQALKPGILVSIRTTQKGNRSYQKRDIERPHLTENGTEQSRWDTTKIVFDPAEAKEASTVANRARYLVTRLCADTEHGPICPSERREELQEAIREARALVAAFNDSAVFTEVSVNVICGEVMADDVNTARALFEETERLMAQMQEAVEKLDTKKIQQLCSKALSVGQMLSPTAAADVQSAVLAAREARKKIVKAGEQAAIQIDRNAIEMIGRARSAFLDFDMEEAEVEPIGHNPRGLDFDPTDNPDFGSVASPATRALDFSDAL